MFNNRKQRLALVSTMIYIHNYMKKSQIKKRRRSVWTKKWLLEQEKYSHVQLLKELKENNPEDYKNYHLRMDNETFSELLNLLRIKLTKKDSDANINSSRGKTNRNA